MEKYRQFGDASTGVHPFLPPWSNIKRAHIIVRLLKGLLVLPFALVRLVLFMLALGWLGLAQLLCALIPVGLIRYPIYRVLSYVGCMIALLALGIVSVADNLGDNRRLKLPPSKSSSSRIFDARRGALIIVNQQGLSDVLVLGLKVCPIFVFTAADGTPVQLSLLGALRRIGARRTAAPPMRPVSLDKIAEQAKSSWQSVAFFPEGARTNGSCVLTWKDKSFAGVASLERPVGTALLSLEYSKTGGYTPHHTVGTSFKHVVFLCMQSWHTVKTTWLSSKDVAPAIKGKTLAEQVQLLRTLLVRMIPGANEVSIGADRHMEFMAFWDKSQSKGYTTQQGNDKKRS